MNIASVLSKYIGNWSNVEFEKVEQVERKKIISKGIWQTQLSIDDTFSEIWIVWV